jgi:hypothetical protein
VEQPWRNAGFIVYDVKGRAVLEKKLGAGKTDIDISTLSAGMYLCRIQNPETGIFAEEKIIKK